MQPYVFPYLGYFQLVSAADVFVFYDDVNFITRGWINRNYILLEDRAHLITVPCIKPSQNRLINSTEVNVNHPQFEKLIKTISMAYKSAPHYSEIMPFVEHCLRKAPRLISDMAAESVELVAEFLKLDVKFKKSSEAKYNNESLQKADRLIDIAKKEGQRSYINLIGGQELYSKDYFARHGINLTFLKPHLDKYPQQRVDTFVPTLSILDALMFCNKAHVRSMLTKYEFV